MPENLLSQPIAAWAIRQYGAEAGLEHFMQSETYAAMMRRSPDSADSLVRAFREPRAEEAVARLERLANDVPSRSREAWAAIRVPVLILATRRDLIHPFEYAETLAGAIPGAALKELTPKSVSPERYRSDTEASIADFLREHFAI